MPCGFGGIAALHCIACAVCIPRRRTMPKGNKPAARAIEWLCLIIGHLTLRNFKSMPESPFQIWSQWAENLTNCELLNEKPRLDEHPDGARGPSNGALAGAPFVSCELAFNGPTASAHPGLGPFSLL